MPILYFGDAPRYLASEVRVVTVGLNPSRLEFPTASPWDRFPDGEDLDDGRGDCRSIEAYLLCLDRYFTIAPYTAWFRPSFEPLLHGLEASFWPGARHAAVHTDLCSPLATDPTWSRLRPAERSVLADGLMLWHDLVETLAPDVILASVARRNLESVRLPGGEWFELHRVERDNPYVCQARWVEIGDRRRLLVWGRAANTPFGTVSAIDKLATGQAIREVLGAR